MKFQIQYSDHADDAIRQAILAPLLSYNESMTGQSGGRPIVLSITDTEAAVIGGLWGRTAYGWLYTELLVVPEHMRGQGIGRDLVERAEKEAVARGCHSAWLDTFQFQARAFYEGLGYVVFGTLDNYPEGFQRYFMVKSLAA